MVKRKILTTSALIYANGAPHLGHLVGTIQSDIWVRFQKMRGHECYFICGSDSHGTPIMIKAEKENLTPLQLIQQNHERQQQDFADFLIEFDNYYPTHSKENEALILEIFKAHVEGGNINKKVIKQFFDPVKEMFLPDRYIKGECPNCGAKEQYGDNCESCGAAYQPTDLKNPYSILSGAKPVEKNSEHYFFKLDAFTKFLKAFIHSGRLPAQVVNKLQEWFKDGLKDWDISRDAPYFGFLIPGETKKYFYVWLDAPVGYISIFKNFCDRTGVPFDDFWKEDSSAELVHFIGKDIVYFHGLFWPAILKGAKYRTPTNIIVNGFLTIDGQKMSKSRGTFIEARTYLKHLSPEYLRYYIAAKLSSKIEDIDLNFDDFIKRINADLIGKYINIASRSASFITKYFDGRLSDISDDEPLIMEFRNKAEEIAARYENFEYSHAVRLIMALADKANQYIDEHKPWTQIREDANKGKAHAVCTVSLNLFRLLTIYLKPILPKTAEMVARFLNIPSLQWDDRNVSLKAHPINPYEPILSRIDPKDVEALKMQVNPEKHNGEKTAAETIDKDTHISIEDFNKIDLRIGKIIQADSVEGADKLLRLKVDLGSQDIRQVFAGIKSAYLPEQLIGREVVVVANLAPRKMRFGVSEGMVIVAKGEGKDGLWLIGPDEGAEPGMKVQ